MKKECNCKCEKLVDPRSIKTIREGATYSVPGYRVTDDGIENYVATTILLCKGDKSDSSVFRQPGMFTESLIEVAKQYLTDVNVGPMATRETAMAITKLDEALMWIGKRTEDRKRRQVQATYEK